MLLLLFFLLLILLVLVLPILLLLLLLLFLLVLLFLFILLLLLLLIALILLLAWRIRSTHPMLRAQKAPTDTQAFLILWDASLLCMGILRCAPLPAETPLQFAARAERTLGMHMTEAAETVSSIRYGRHSVRKEMSDSMKDIYQALEERLSLWQKLRLSLARALRFR